MSKVYREIERLAKLGIDAGYIETELDGCKVLSIANGEKTTTTGFDRTFIQRLKLEYDGDLYAKVIIQLIVPTRDEFIKEQKGVKLTVDFDDGWFNAEFADAYDYKEYFWRKAKNPTFREGVELLHRTLLERRTILNEVLRMVPSTQMDVCCFEDFGFIKNIFVALAKKLVEALLAHPTLKNILDIIRHSIPITHSMSTKDVVENPEPEPVPEPPKKKETKPSKEALTRSANKARDAKKREKEEFQRQVAEAEKRRAEEEEQKRRAKKSAKKNSV